MSGQEWKNLKFYILWSDNNALFERLDIIKDIDDYDMINTFNCEASRFIQGGRIYTFGDNKMLDTVYNIKHVASFTHVPEKKNVSVKDGKFVISIVKDASDTGVYYEKIMINGKIDKEVYRTEDGEILITSVSPSISGADAHPINWDSYELKTATGTKKGVDAIKVATTEFLSYNEIIRKFPQVIHVLDNDYVVIESYEEAEERLKKWIESPEQLKSVDIESLSTTWGPGSNNRITGVFLGLGTEWSTYFPFRQDNFSYNLPLEYLKKIFDAVNNQPPAPKVLILAHNAKFEIQGFYQEFEDYLRVDIDTYLLAVLVNPLIKKGSHTLKNLTAQVDNKFYISLEDIFIGPVKFNVLTPDIVKLYGCPDATSPAKLYPWLMSQLPKDEYFVMSLEMGLPYVKAMNEFYGIRMDQSKLLTLIEDEEDKINRLESLFRGIHKTSKNINSADVLREIIYNKLKCKVEVWTDKGLPATSKVAIERIVKVGTLKINEETKVPEDIRDRNGKSIIKGKELVSNRYPSLVIYQTYKKCLKEVGALRRLRDRSLVGRFKFYINQVGAGSNRQTSDAHQFSDTMKSCALADSPYHGLVSCDWKQVELRILAGMAGEEELVKMECDPGVDIHRAILSIIQKKPMYLISEEDRKNGKSVNFGVVYGMTEYGLAVWDFGPAYTKANLETERKKITDFFNGMPMVKKFIKDNEMFLRKNGFVKTLFNYYRYFKEILDPTCDSKLVSKMIKAGGNTPIQGTGAQMLKIVETKVWEYIKKKGWDKCKDYGGIRLPMVRMILPIHDEILLSYDKSIPKEEIIKMFKECMELDIKGMPPFFAAPAFIDNWLEAKNPVYEVDITLRDEIVENWNNGIGTFNETNYIEVLQNFRDRELSSYMNGLIQKYHTVDEVAKHVTDDNLTHTLIETLIPDKADRKALTHIERIHEATRRYMAKRENGDIIEVTPEELKEDTSSNFAPIDEWAEKYIYTDQFGDVIEEVDEEEEVITEFVDELLPIEERVAERCDVLYLMSECLVDLTNYDISTTGERIHQRIAKLHNPKEFYNVTYVIGNKTLKTGFKIGYVPEKITEIINNVMEEEKHG